MGRSAPDKPTASKPTVDKPSPIDVPTERAARPPQPLTQRSKTAKGAIGGVKAILGMVSVVILSLTGYAWATLNAGMTRADLFDRQAAVGEKHADGAMDILLVGIDSRHDAQGNPLPADILRELRAGYEDSELTDTLILLRVSDEGGQANAFSFPRDSYVEMPDGFGKHKINSAYVRAKNDNRAKLGKQKGLSKEKIEQDSANEGRKMVVKTVQDFAGVEIDHFAEVNLLGFYEITKAIGGVDVCLNKAVNEFRSGARFAAGPQTVQGADALAFVRQRYELPNSDFDRVRRQQVFMASMAQKILSTGVLTNPRRINDLVAAVQRSVVLDDGWDLLGFAQQARTLTGGNMTFHTIPNIGFEKVDGEDVIAVDRRAVQRFIREQGSEQAPEPTDGRGAGGDARATVDVSNGTKITGLATGVQEALAAKDFPAGTTSNADPLSKSVVKHAKGDEAAAMAVATALGGLPLEVDPRATPGRVHVLLGRDYEGPKGVGGIAAAEVGGANSAKQPPAPGSDAPPITANGVPCVN